MATHEESAEETEQGIKNLVQIHLRIIKDGRVITFDTAIPEDALKSLDAKELLWYKTKQFFEAIGAKT